MSATKMLKDGHLTVETFLNRLTYEHDSIYKSLDIAEPNVNFDVENEEDLCIPSSSSSLSQSSQSSVSSSQSSSQINRMCYHCKFNYCVVLLLPCAHNVYCASCINIVAQKELFCPICYVKSISHVVAQ